VGGEERDSVSQCVCGGGGGSELNSQQVAPVYLVYNVIPALSSEAGLACSLRVLCLVPCVTSSVDRAIAEAVSRRRLGFEPRSGRICGGQSGTGAGFLRVLRIPLPILIPPTAPHSSSIVRGWYNRPVSGRRTKWTQSHPTPKKLKKVISIFIQRSRGLLCRTS
jgi:hypothetical protein